ncbi:unnamed protein product [Haemonchus placei]|uniref:Uncharacterized protein n=1 Tax=Haemonchus placei TaxID=6290 RepID=A0A3P7WGI3_HAEPC|nr:unnamed protein product [Haemonchus placei]
MQRLFVGFDSPTPSHEGRGIFGFGLTSSSSSSFGVVNDGVVTSDLLQHACSKHSPSSTSCLTRSMLCRRTSSGGLNSSNCFSRTSSRSLSSLSLE